MRDIFGRNCEFLYLFQMTMFKRNMLSFHLNNDLSNQMLQVLCKGMKQRPTFNYDYGHQRIFPQFECYFVKIVIE